MMSQQDKKIEDMTGEEWEAICVRCGKCCYYKYLIEETDELEYGDVCEFLDEETKLCTCYETRSVEKPDCLKLTPQNIEENAWWLPEECAYLKKL
jgi:uncharacterized cysteine cluster protein YcgN (CxxCxxCC family)